MKRILNIAAAVLLAAAVLSSCDPGTMGLFEMLEQEKPLNKGTPALNANTAQFVVRFGTNYYAAVGRTLLTRPAAGGVWTTVSTAPSGYEITSGVVAGGTMYILAALSPGRVYSSNDGSNWTPFGDYSALVQDPDEIPVGLMSANNQLFLASRWSTEDPDTTHYAVYYNDAGTFDPSPITNAICGLPSSIAWDGTNYWITAGNAIFRGTTPGLLINDSVNVAGAFTASNPVLSVWYDSVNGGVIAAATGKVWRLTVGGYTPSGSFGSSAQLSSVVVVPKNGGGDATIIGAKSWGSSSNTGYFEYNATQNSLANFGINVVPSSAYDMVSDNSNYVTTLDDLSIEGFYYDDTPGEETLFARTVMGGLWSNRFNDTTDTWSGWDRE